VVNPKRGQVDSRPESRNQAAPAPDEVLSAKVRISQGEFWTVSDLQVAVKQWYGVVYQDRDSYRRLLHSCDFTYQRTEAVYRSQANEHKRAAFEQQLKKKSLDS